ANPSITVTGPSFPQGQSFSATWGQVLSIANLQVGSYTLSTPDIQTPSQIYTAMFSPNPSVVSGSTPVNINLSYSVKALGSLFVHMPSAPALSITAPVISVIGPDFPTATSFQTAWAS